MTFAFLHHVYKGKYEDGDILYQRALAIKKKVYGQDHPEVASTLNNRALLLKSQVRCWRAILCESGNLECCVETLMPFFNLIFVGVGKVRFPNAYTLKRSCLAAHPVPLRGLTRHHALMRRPVRSLHFPSLHDWHRGGRCLLCFAQRCSMLSHISRPVDNLHADSLAVWP